MSKTKLRLKKINKKSPMTFRNILIVILFILIIITGLLLSKNKFSYSSKADIHISPIKLPTIIVPTVRPLNITTSNITPPTQAQISTLTSILGLLFNAFFSQSQTNSSVQPAPPTNSNTPVSPAATISLTPTPTPITNIPINNSQPPVVPSVPPPQMTAGKCHVTSMLGNSDYVENGPSTSCRCVNFFGNHCSQVVYCDCPTGVCECNISSEPDVNGSKNNCNPGSITLKKVDSCP